MMASSKQLGVRFIVSGRVQGVAFRAFTRRAARELKICGWARNRPDGTVEIRAWGSEEQLTQLREKVQRGPIVARVDRLEEEALETAAPGETFEIVFS
ncbi:MAG: acylphosphatase [Deltaproteobacteria bacterium]|nr:acylphosphatase [Deltaproteobacteria bacterium]